jgi:hypothetical protein
MGRIERKKVDLTESGFCVIMGAIWKGSIAVSDSRSIKELSGLEPGGVFRTRDYFGFGFYFAYASALGRCPAPGEGTPE